MLTVSTSPRSDVEQAQWNWSLPCYNCTIRPVCQYVTHLQALSFPKFFKVTIQCDMKNKHGGDSK